MNDGLICVNTLHSARRDIENRKTIATVWSMELFHVREAPTTMRHPISRWLALFIALVFFGTQSAAAMEVCLEGAPLDGRVGYIAPHCDDDGPRNVAVCSAWESSVERRAEQATISNSPLPLASAATSRLLDDTGKALRLSAYGHLPPPAARITPFSILFGNFRS